MRAAANFLLYDWKNIPSPIAGWWKVAGCFWKWAGQESSVRRRFVKQAGVKGNYFLCDFKSSFCRIAVGRLLRIMLRAFLLLLLTILSPLSAMAEAQPFQKIERCKMKADRWNDGDSFHVITGDANREIVARLYFVDTPEAETAYRDRLDEQAAYFGITREQATNIAHEAAAFPLDLPP